MKSFRPSFFVWSCCMALLFASQLAADDSSSQAASLVVQLGADSFAAREAAEEQLKELGVTAFPSLFDALRSDDAERVRRARRLITRLEGDAFAELNRELNSADEARAEQARLLLAGLSDRLVQRKLDELISRIDAAVEQGTVTSAEQRNWTSQLTRGQIALIVDDRGQVVETGLERQLACREALSPESMDAESSLVSAELQAFREGGKIEARFAPAWDAVVARAADSAELRGLFADMVAAEPLLIAAAAEVFAVRETDRDEAARRGLMLGGLFDLRSQQFTVSFRESKQGQRPESGKPYPDVYDDMTVGRLTSFLFVRSELAEHIPTVTLGGGESTALIDGMAGYYNSKQPLFEMLKKADGDRPKAIRQYLELAALTAKTGPELHQSLTIAMYYRLNDVCRTLAARIVDDEPEVYNNAYQQANANLLAGHALLSFGNKSAEDLELAARLLPNDAQIRGGYRKEDKRQYIEVREMGMMALLRMLGRRPEDIGGTAKVTGYCPVKRFTKFDAIRDTERWGEITNHLQQWIGAAKGEKP